MGVKLLDCQLAKKILMNLVHYTLCVRQTRPAIQALRRIHRGTRVTFELYTHKSLIQHPKTLNKTYISSPTTNQNL